METLFAIGMIVGLMKGRAEPLKPPAPPTLVEQQRQVAQHTVETVKPPPRKKSEWLLSY